MTDITNVITAALAGRAATLRSLATSTSLPAGLAQASPNLVDLVERGRAELLADAGALEVLAAGADGHNLSKLRDPWVVAALRAHAEDLRARAAAGVESLPSPNNVWATGPTLGQLVDRGRRALECDADEVERAALDLEAHEEF